MRLFFLSVLACIALALPLSDASALRNTARKATTAKLTVTGCSSVQGIGKNVYKNSKPHRACARVNCPIDYFERFPSLLINQRGLPRPGSATLIDGNGKSLISCGQLACRDCAAGYRYVCRGNTNSISKQVKRNTGNYAAYYKLGSACVQIPDIGRCIGSVKGLCNQALH